jgi:hypothetical protein
MGHRDFWGANVKGPIRVPVGSGGSSSKKVRTSAVSPWLGKTRQGLGFWGEAKLAAP